MFDFKNASKSDLKKKWKEIAKELGDDGFFTRKELDHLPGVLADKEQVLAFSSGLMDGNTWLIALTDKRVIFLDKGMLYGLKQVIVPLDEIKAISCKTGLMFGEIHVESASKYKIEFVLKATVIPFTNKTREAMDALKAPQPSAAVTDAAPREDFISQLERLGALRTSGILTQEEFEKQKSLILARAI